MTKAELESKHIAELHTLAAEAGVEGYRMLRREDLVEKLLDAGQGEAAEKPKRERPPRRRRERPAKAVAEPAAEEPAPSPGGEPASSPTEPARTPRRRRRRRFGRKSKGLRIADLLAPPPGRQALVYGEGRDACTALLREVAGELSGASDGPDPIALLVDPSPEELADWRREAPQAEIVVAGQARHASDALAQAVRRADGGEDVILLVDSLTRLEDTDAAKQIFDAASGSKANGSLTVVAALERPS